MYFLTTSFVRWSINFLLCRGPFYVYCCSPHNLTRSPFNLSLVNYKCFFFKKKLHCFMNWQFIILLVVKYPTNNKPFCQQESLSLEDQSPAWQPVGAKWKIVNRFVGPKVNKFKWGNPGWTSFNRSRGRGFFLNKYEQIQRVYEAKGSPCGLGLPCEKGGGQCQDRVSPSTLNWQVRLKTLPSRKLRMWVLTKDPAMNPLLLVTIRYLCKSAQLINCISVNLHKFT